VNGSDSGGAGVEAFCLYIGLVALAFPQLFLETSFFSSCTRTSGIFRLGGTIIIIVGKFAVTDGDRIDRRANQQSIKQKFAQLRQ